MGGMDARLTGLRDRFVQLMAPVPAQGQGLGALRRLGLEAFRRMGIPDRRGERYRYADLASCLDVDWQLQLAPTPDITPSSCIFRCEVPQLDAHTLYFRNGFLQPEAGAIRLQRLPGGILIGSLAAALEEEPDLVMRHLARGDGNEAWGENVLIDGLAALSQALAMDGAFVFVPEGQVLDKPVQIISISDAGHPLLYGMRHLVVAGARAEAKVVLCTHSFAPVDFACNEILEIYAAEGAQVELNAMQNAHNEEAEFLHSFAYMARDARLVFNTISLHGGFIRNNAHIKLLGEGVQAQVNALSLVDRHQYVDTHVEVDHIAPGCQSTQLIKNLVDEQGEVSFHGVIHVRPHAQRTLAYQRNANLLLTDQARAHTRPQLIIHADDVKCSHGAVTGHLDEDARFYLRSRGISPLEVNRLLMYAFAHDIVQSIGVVPLRDRVARLVDRRIRGERDSCHSEIERP